MHEEDPALAATALPTLMKLSEALLEGNPRDQGAVVQTASLYVMYGSAFLEGGAEALPAERFEEKRETSLRALALYRRAFRLLGPALERRSPGILALETYAGSDEKAEKGFGRFTTRDIPLLYWSAASLLAAFAVNPLDLETAGRIGLAQALLKRALELDPGWDRGTLQELALTVYASFPDYLGGDLAAAEEAYRRGLEYSAGGSASLYVTYAGTVCVSRDDYQAFRASLEAALAIDPRARPDSRLATVLAQTKARRMLDRIDDYFFIP